MARRRIGQETFAFGSSDAGRRCSLDDLHDLIDWAPIDRRLASISCSAKGEPAWPPLALFKAMLPLHALLFDGEPHPDDFQCDYLGLAIDSNSGKGAPDRDGCAARIFALTLGVTQSCPIFPLVTQAL